MTNPFSIPGQAQGQADPFTTPGAGGNTRVHQFPLPPEGRDYRPTYVRGQYYLPDPHQPGKMSSFTRVTTGAHALEDTSNLEAWKMGNVVLGIKSKPELLDMVDLWLDPIDVKRQLRNVADLAQEVAGANEASELGTAIHAWTEAVERDGLDPAEVPPQFQPYVNAYLATLKEWGISTVPGMVERIVYNSTTGWVGTLDRLYTLADGTRVIGDVKTSKSLRYSYLSFAIQMATYAGADYMLSTDGKTWEPMPAVSNAFGVIAHVPSDNPGWCELVTLDLASGTFAMELAQTVRKVREQAGVVIPNVWEIPRPGPDLEAMVRKCSTPADLAKLWEDNQDVWTEELTALGMEVIRSISAGSPK